MQSSLVFQPKHIGIFKCDGSKCNACCCRYWGIIVDKKTYERYPQEFAAHFEFDSERKGYRVILNEKNSCPFLTDEKLCRIQLEYGEDFLSLTCRTYPRIINFLGTFFERSLLLSCPVAAEMILFNDKPTDFELIEVPRKEFNQFMISPIRVDKKFHEQIIPIQLAMILILQERALTIDQRLITLGFFLDKLDEISADTLDEDALKKLLETYGSKKFLTEQVPRFIRELSFDEEKFSRLMLSIFDKMPIPGADVAANFGLIKHFRKKFRMEHSIFLENYLVNEIFLLFCPWRFEGSIANNFGFFVARYKMFELMLMSIGIKIPLGRLELLRLARNFSVKIGHNEENQRKIFLAFNEEGDILNLIESLLEGSD